MRPQVLDGITVKNLELVANTADGTTKGTLLGTLDTCATAFGKRYGTAAALRTTEAAGEAPRQSCHSGQELESSPKAFNCKLQCRELNLQLLRTQRNVFFCDERFFFQRCSLSVKHFVQRVAFSNIKLIDSYSRILARHVCRPAFPDQCVTLYPRRCRQCAARLGVQSAPRAGRHCRSTGRRG